MATGLAKMFLMSVDARQDLLVSSPGLLEATADGESFTCIDKEALSKSLGHANLPWA